MTILVTGITGYVGSVLAARLTREGHSVRGFARSPERVTLDVPVVAGDAITGEGLAQALDGVDVAYFLIHGMEPATDGPFAPRERAAAERFAQAARAAGVHRIVYLGGIAPAHGAPSFTQRSSSCFCAALSERCDFGHQGRRVGLSRGWPREPPI